MDGRNAAMDRYQARYGGRGPFGIPKTGIMDFLGGLTQQADPRDGFLGGLQSGLGGALGAGARRMQSQDEMERQAMLQDLEQRRVAATEQSAGADVMRAQADWKRANAPAAAPGWNDLNPMQRADQMLPWLKEHYPGVPEQQLIPMVGGIDQPDTPSPDSDPRVAEAVAQAYANKFTGGDLDAARIALRFRKPQRFTDEVTEPVLNPQGGTTALRKRIITSYSYGDPDLDAALNSAAPQWARANAGAGGGGGGGGTLDPSKMTPEDASDYNAAMTLIREFQKRYPGAGR